MTTTATTAKTMTAAESTDLIASSTFKTYADHIEAGRRGTLVMWAQPDADELAQLVVPFTYCPNVADLLETSNWECLRAAIADVDPDGADHSVKSFGHWATPYDMLTVRAGSAAHRVAEECIAVLADYPVLNDEDYNERQYVQQHEDIAGGLSSLTILAEDGEEIDTDAPPADSDRATRQTYLVHQIWEHMWNDGQLWRCLEETGQAGGGGVDRDDVEAALEEMGYERTDGFGEWRLTADTE